MKTIEIEVKNWKWKDGARIKADPNVIGKELEILTNELGSITVDTYVRQARNPESPLYETITHDKDIAIEKLNKIEAGHILRCLITVKIENDGSKRDVPTLQNISERGGEYTRTEIALGNADGRKIALKEALAQMRWFRKKYAELKELAAVFEAMDDVLGDEDND